MKVFIYVLQLPENKWDDRTVVSSMEYGSHIIYWNTKELNGYFSGEFGWKKLDSFGVCALQYMNQTKVRLIVRAGSKEIADSIVKSFSWHIDAKKTGKRPYARRCSQTKLIMAANNLATKQSIHIAS